MRWILGVILAVALASCLMVNLRLESNELESYESDSASEEKLSLSDSIGQIMCLNEIRFRDFDDDDWRDNEYIRTLRRYLDEYSRGKVEYEELEPYRDIVNGQFVIDKVSPSVGGGLFIQFVFIERPNYLFAAHVYSTVDEETGEVDNYELRYVRMSYGEYDVTKEEILELMKEHPEAKSW